MRSYIIRSLRRGRIRRKIGAERLGASDATDHPTVVFAIVTRAWVDLRAVEAHVVSGVAIVSRSGPIAPVGIGITTVN